ncbi:DUF6064 family protein [Minwuia sp.]|uniref:DUF6064 family protein n=1 Tax=Minwuia sp. TaxID=2493630 RepID=UPI003A917579
MGDWLTYSLSDFLMFGPETYWRLFERANEGSGLIDTLRRILPALLLILSLGPFRAGSANVRAGFVILCATMLWVAWSFIWDLYRPIYWPMAYLAPVYALGGAVFIAAALTEPREIESAAGRSALRVTLGLIAFAYVYAVLGAVVERSIQSVELISVAPDPTAVAALGFALLARRLWHRALLLAVPVIWLSISAITLYALGSLQWIALLIAILIALQSLVRHRSQAGPSL